MAAAQPLSSETRHDSQRFTDVSAEPDKILSPLPAVVFTTFETFSLYDVVKPIYPLVENLPNQVAYCLEKCRELKDDLTLDESASIYLYTLQWPQGKLSFYTILNSALRDENRLKLAPFQQYLNLFMSAFHKLPSIQDRIWRGETGDWGAQYKQGAIHVWRGVSSCSDMIHVTGGFLDTTKKHTLFNIKCMNGKVIKNHSDFPNESEIILPPGTYLKVKSSLNPTPEMCIVDLEEIIPTAEELAQLATASALSAASSSNSYVRILWLNSNINISSDYRKTQEKLELLFKTNFKIFESSEEVVNYIINNQDRQIILILHAETAQELALKIKNLAHINSMIVYYKSEEEVQIEWSASHEKVKTVLFELSAIITIVQKLYVDLAKSEAKHYLLHGISNQPLLSLKDSLQGLCEMIPDLQHHIEIAMMNSERPADGFTPDESAAIYIYMMQWEPYESCLYHLLSKDLCSEPSDLMKRLPPYLHLLLHAMNKLPSYKGITWRSVANCMNDHFNVGEIGIWNSITPTTCNMDGLNFSLGSGECTLFQIECKSGKNIRNHSYFSCEDEIILLPGFCYEVTGKVQATKKLFIVTLKEVELASEEIDPPVTLPADCNITSHAVCMPSSYVLWLDANVNKFQHKQLQQELKRLFGESFKSFENLEETFNFINDNQNKRFLLISSGQNGKQIVPRINHLLQLHFVIIFCMNKEANEKWSKDYEKVKEVIVDENELIEKATKLFLFNTLEKLHVTGRISDVMNDDAKFQLFLLREVMNQPLLSLEDSLQGLCEMIPDLQHHIEIAMMNSKRPADGFTPDESAAIYIYTMAWCPFKSCLYNLLNKDLRSGSYRECQIWSPYLKLLIFAMNKLPSYQGYVWRCVPKHSGYYRDQNSFTWRGISSTTEKIDTIFSFLGSLGDCTLFSIKCKTGKRIQNHSSVPNVNEVLLLPCVDLNVISILDAGENLNVIHVEEIDSPFQFVGNIAKKVCQNMPLTQGQVDENTDTTAEKICEEQPTKSTFNKIFSFFKQSLN